MNKKKPTGPEIPFTIVDQEEYNEKHAAATHIREQIHHTDGLDPSEKAELLDLIDHYTLSIDNE